MTYWQAVALTFMCADVCDGGYPIMVCSIERES